MLSTSHFNPKTDDISESNFQKMAQYKSSLSLDLSLIHIIRVKRVFSNLAYYSFSGAINHLKGITYGGVFKAKLDTYINFKYKTFLKNIREAKYEIPDFDDIYKLYKSNKKGDLSSFIENIRDFIDTPTGKYFYIISMRKQKIKTNKDEQIKYFYKEIEDFLKYYKIYDNEENYDVELLNHILTIFPELMEKYLVLMVRNDKKKKEGDQNKIGISNFDFTGINKVITKKSKKISKQINNIFTLAKMDDKKDYMVKIKTLITSTNSYPLFGLGVEIIDSKGKVKKIPMVKISPNQMIAIKDAKRKEFIYYNFEGIFQKIEESIQFMKSPISPFWFSTYKNRYPEVYQYIVKPFWSNFLKFLVALCFCFLISVFTIKYFKTIYPKNLKFYFYFLPFIFLMIVSIVYANFVIKSINMVLALF